MINENNLLTIDLSEIKPGTPGVKVTDSSTGKSYYLPVLPESALKTDEELSAIWQGIDESSIQPGTPCVRITCGDKSAIVPLLPWSDKIEQKSGVLYLFDATDEDTFTEVEGHTFKQVKVFGASVFAQDTDDVWWAWGDNTEGRLGYDASQSYIASPVPLIQPDSLYEISGETYPKVIDVAIGGFDDTFIVYLDTPDTVSLASNRSDMDSTYEDYTVISGTFVRTSIEDRYTGSHPIYDNREPIKLLPVYGLGIFIWDGESTGGQTWLACGRSDNGEFGYDGGGAGSFWRLSFKNKEDIESIVGMYDYRPIINSSTGNSFCFDSNGNKNEFAKRFKKVEYGVEYSYALDTNGSLWISDDTDIDAKLANGNASTIQFSEAPSDIKFLDFAVMGVLIYSVGTDGRVYSAFRENLIGQQTENQFNRIGTLEGANKLFILTPVTSSIMYCSTSDGFVYEYSGIIEFKKISDFTYADIQPFQLDNEHVSKRLYMLTK